MKFKNIFFSLLGGMLIGACTPDDADVYLNPVKPADIKILELMADHETLLPDGEAEMNFRIMAYGIKEIKVMKKYETSDSLSYTEVLDTLVYQIPGDELPAGYLAVYDEEGNKVENNVFSTTRTDWDVLRFYAQGGDLKSNVLEIKRRDLPDPNEYQEIVYPVIFHLLVPPANARPSYSISVEKLQEKLDRVNNIFNGLISKNPNGGNAKIVFKLAEYDQNGNLLAEKGKEVINLSSDMNQTAYEQYINTPGRIWDPNRYLNIFVAKYSDNWTSTGASTYIAVPPTVIQKGQEAIPGITAKEVEDFTAADVTKYKDVAILLNYEGVLNVNSMEKNDATELATIFGYYLGLKTMQYSERYNWETGEDENNLIDGDTDFCPDTYFYDPLNNFTIFKTEKAEGKRYTSFNIMEGNSRKNSITVDQARRMRMVTDRCPSRWSYKSNWAFNGKHD